MSILKRIDVYSKVFLYTLCIYSVNIYDVSPGDYLPQIPSRLLTNLEKCLIPLIGAAVFFKRFFLCGTGIEDCKHFVKNMTWRIPRDHLCAPQHRHEKPVLYFFYRETCNMLFF